MPWKTSRTFQIISEYSTKVQKKFKRFQNSIYILEKLGTFLKIRRIKINIEKI